MKQRTIKIWLGSTAFEKEFDKILPAPDVPKEWVLKKVKVHIDKIVFYYDESKI